MNAIQFIQQHGVAGYATLVEQELSITKRDSNDGELECQLLTT